MHEQHPAGDRPLRPHTARAPLDPARATVSSLLVAWAVLAAGCGGRASARAPRVSVSVARVETRDVPVAIDATGTVEPIQSAAVGSQVGGVIQKIAFQEGQEVEANQVLVVLDPRPFRAAVEQARATLAKDVALWRSARNDAARGDKLLAENVIAPADHDKLVAAAEGLRATVAADSAALAKARLDLEYSAIRAPVAGRTGKLNVHVGDLVKAATSDPLVTINQLRPIYVRFTVPQSDLPLVQRYRDAGPRVFVHSAAGDSMEIEGRLAFIDNTVDPSSGTLTLKGEFPNRDGRLWPGEFVEVRLELTHQRGVTVVPAPAVTNGQQGTYVYVLNPDSTTSARPVTVSRSDDVTAVIASGLKAGETVITDGQFRIAPGARVMVRGGHQDSTP